MNRILLLFCLVLLSQVLFAQTDGLPPNPQPGKCYVKCVSHDEFRRDTVRILVKPEYKVLTVIPATYKWVEEKVMIKEASKKFIYHPAEYEWKEVPYVKKEVEKVLTIDPASFGDDSKEIKVFPETGGWEYKTYPNCKSSNPDDCRVLCYVEKAAQYVNIPIKTLSKDAAIKETSKPEKPATYRQQVIAKKAYVEEIEIPAKYSIIKRQVIDQPAKTVEKIIPAVYKTVNINVLEKKGGISTWEEIDCGLVEPTTLDILWNLNSAKLRADAKRKIDEALLTLLNEKPNITIELASHTDSRGSDEYNKALSQRRADAVKNYLVSKGIAAHRIISKGYGETRLKNNCANGVPCSEAQHQQNRRTEYKVLSTQ